MGDEAECSKWRRRRDSRRVRKMENLGRLVKALCQETAERTWVEFKHNNYKPEMIGQSVSALANGSALADKTRGYMVWGVEDGSHKVVGTERDLQNIKKGGEELENWLRHRLSPNADFEYGTCFIDGQRVGVLAVEKASRRPVTFEKEAYIRVGSYTKALRNVPALEARLWDKLLASPFEIGSAKGDLSIGDALALLDVGRYYDMLEKRQPSTSVGISHDLLQEGILAKQDDGLHSVTNLGAILLAKRLGDFPGLSRKALRIVQYRGNSRAERIKESDSGEGYALALGSALSFIEAVLPAREEIVGAERVAQTEYPSVALREVVANALIHQDFSATGTGPAVELFDRRIEITNPGAPLIDIDRLIDSPPKSRNEKLAALMRRFRLCEEMGTGWDKIAISCEQSKLPAPRMTVFDGAEATRVTLEAHRPFSRYTLDDRVHSCYMHACLCQVQQVQMSNASLRERLGLPETSAGMVSRIIKEALARGLIKPYDPDAGRRYVKYIPYWG